MKIEVKDLGSNNEIFIHDSVKKSGNMTIVIEGSNNMLLIDAGTNLGNGLIEIRNNFSKIEIGQNCLINGWLRCRSNYTNLHIGRETTIMWAQITLHEKGAINIGEDCMLSGDIRMDVSDMHSILDAETKMRLNPPADINIENHVWVGQGVHILKGNSIGHDAILGAKALVASSIPNNSIAVGVPAKVVKSGVTWDRKILPFDE